MPVFPWQALPTQTCGASPWNRPSPPRSWVGRSQSKVVEAEARLDHVLPLYVLLLSRPKPPFGQDGPGRCHWRPGRREAGVVGRFGLVVGRSRAGRKVGVRLELTYQVSWTNRPKFLLLWRAGIASGRSGCLRRS